MGKTQQQRMKEIILRAFTEFIRGTGALTWDDGKCLYVQRVGSVTARIPHDDAVMLAIEFVMCAENEGKDKAIVLDLSKWTMPI